MCNGIEEAIHRRQTCDRAPGVHPEFFSFKKLMPLLKIKGRKINRPTKFRKNTTVALSTVCEAKRIQTPMTENRKAEQVRKTIALTRCEERLHS